MIAASVAFPFIETINKVCYGGFGCGLCEVKMVVLSLWFLKRKVLMDLAGVHLTLIMIRTQFGDLVPR